MTVVSIDSQARNLPVFKGAAMCNPGFRRVCGGGLRLPSGPQKQLSDMTYCEANLISLLRKD